MRKSRRQVTINSRPFMASCGRCSAVMLPNATVCRSCGGFAVDNDRRIDYDRIVVRHDIQRVLEDAAPAYAMPNPGRVSTVLSCWPFGAADPSDGPAFNAPAEPAPQAPRFEPYPYRTDVPTQRTEPESVPSFGPNPFLSAALMQLAREEVTAL